MWELFQAAIAPANLPYTVLLGLILLYWLLYLLGMLGEDALDFLGLDLDADVDVDVDADVDIDIDADVDVDADLDADMGGAGPAGALVSVLSFFHVGEVPVIIIFSILALATWLISIVATQLIGRADFVIGLMLFVPVFLGGLIVTKTLVMPFAPYLKKVLNQSGDKVQVVGRRCVVTSIEATPKYGQAEMPTEGAPLLLNVKTRDGVTLHKGDEAVVFDYDKPTSVYFIAALDIDTPAVKE